MKKLIYKYNNSRLIPKGQLGLISKLIRKPSTLNKVFGNYSVYDKEASNRIKKFFARELINGRSYGLKDPHVALGLPSNISNNLLENTVERNIRAMRKAGYSETEIELYRDHISNLLKTVKVGLYSGSQYSAANIDFEGFYNNDDFFISVNKDSKKYSPSVILKHEGRHMIDSRSDMTDDLRKYLQEAYDKDFLNLPNLEDAGSLKGYKYMNRERVTTNMDSRNYLLNYSWNEVPLDKIKYSQHPLSNGISDMIDGLNAVIADASDEEIFSAVKNANNYGRKYINFLHKQGKLTPEKAELFRKAMMYVGSYTLPVAGGVSLILNNNKQKNNK